MMNDNQHIPSGYKPSPLGIIPEDWEVKSLGEIFTFKNGVNASKESYGEGVKFVNTMDVLNNTFIDSHVIRGKVKVNDKIKEEFIVSCGDVLFNRTSETREEVGCSAVYNDSEEAVFGGFIIRAHDIKSNTLGLLYKGYCFQPSYIRNQISALGNGAIRYNLGQEDLSRVKLLIPPLPEQQRIVSVLSLWDTAIAKQTALIEKLTLRKRGLMQQLLTGKKRLKGFEGKWKEVRLGDVAQITMGQSPDSRYYNETGEGLPLIQGNADIKDRKSTQRIWTSSITKVCECNDIIMSVRAPVGEIAVATQKSCIGRGVCSITSTNVNAEYLFQLLLLLENSWGNIEQGGTFTSINSQEIQKKKVSIPKQSEQEAIATILTIADKEIEIQKQKLAALQEQKKGLMQVLLTGRKRTKTTSL